MPEQVSQELLVAIESALRAGSAILAIYRTDFSVRMKEKDDPVTDADMQAHQSVANLLAENFPKDILLSEEDLPDKKDRLDNNRVWILDPLDGTRDFVERNPEFAFSLGLSIGGEAKLGVVYNPVTFELFWGEVGFGYGFTGLNEDTVKSILDSLDGAHDSNHLLSDLISSSRQNIANDNSVSQNKGFYKIMVSRNEMKSNLYQKYLENPIFSERFKIFSVGSIAYKLGLLVKGDVDIVLSLKPKNEWDICGGIAILDAMDGYTSFEIHSEMKYSFNREDTRTFGLIAGREKLVAEFWKENKMNLQDSLKNWDGTPIEE